MSLKLRVRVKTIKSVRNGKLEVEVDVNKHINANNLQEGSLWIMWT